MINLKTCPNFCNIFDNLIVPSSWNKILWMKESWQKAPSFILSNNIASNPNSLSHLMKDWFQNLWENISEFIIYKDRNTSHELSDFRFKGNINNTYFSWIIEVKLSLNNKFWLKDHVNEIVNSKTYNFYNKINLWAHLNINKECLDIYLLYVPSNYSEFLKDKKDLACISTNWVLNYQNLNQPLFSISISKIYQEFRKGNYDFFNIDYLKKETIEYKKFSKYSSSWNYEKYSNFVNNSLFSTNDYLLIIQGESFHSKSLETYYMWLKKDATLEKVLLSLHPSNWNIFIKSIPYKTKNWIINCINFLC